MSLLAWPLTILALTFMYPWVCWLLCRSGRSNKLLATVTTLGLSLGTLSQVMLWQGLIALRIDWRITVVLCAGISVVGWVVIRRTTSRVMEPVGADPPRRQPPPVGAGLRPALNFWRFDLTTFAVILIGVMAGLMLFNAVYWPFGIDDAIAIYASFGKQIAQTGQLPRGTLYELYPMLVPLSYAFTHQAAGWIDEHLAALIPALLSVGVIGVAYLSGKQLYDRATGLTAALLVALTPMIAHWASAGYVDLPTGFFYGLSAVFLLRLDRSGARRDALLAGIMAGLAAWTKNSGLLIVLSVVAWIVYRWWRPGDRRLTVRLIMLIVVGFAVVAGPWYARNVVMAGTPVPPTGWTWKADRSLADLVPYIEDSRYFVTGWIFTAGLLLMAWQAWRLRKQATPIFLLIFYLPFFAIWWALFSYDDRFLLVLTPFVAVTGARVVQEIARRIPAQYTQYARIAAVVVIVGLALPAASAAVDFKGELLRRPFMSDADKHRVRLGADRYNMALYLRVLPPGSRIWTQDLLLPYHADGVEMTVGGWPTQEQLESYDYWLLSPGDALPEWLGADSPVHAEGQYRLYRLTH
jgi:hypothetical protein